MKMRLLCQPVLIVLLSVLMISCANEEAGILTPKPGTEPRINGTKIFGVKPGSPFLFKIAATGEKPMKIQVRYQVS